MFDKEVPDTSASAGVYPTGWLVQDDRLGISNKGQGHTEAALHPPGQWGDHRVLDMPQVHIVEQTENRKYKKIKLCLQATEYNAKNKNSEIDWISIKTELFLHSDWSYLSISCFLLLLEKPDLTAQ